MSGFGPYNSRSNRFKANKNNKEFLFNILSAILFLFGKEKLYLNVSFAS